MYAGFLQRFLALAVDVIVVFVIQLGMYAAQIAMPTSERNSTLIALGARGVVVWAYFALMESSELQATLGKLAMGIKVMDTSGGRIGIARASLRFLAKSLSTASLMVGWIMAATTPRRQALHDVIAGTVVIRKEREDELRSHHWDPTVSRLVEYWDGGQWHRGPRP